MTLAETPDGDERTLFIDETALLETLGQAKRVLLVEPRYRRKYPPLGLAKIATFVKRHGGEVVFTRKPTPGDYDLVCVTSLFTHASLPVRDAIREASCVLPDAPILLGGVAATLVPNAVAGSALVYRGYSQALDECVPDYSIDWGVEEKWSKFSFTFTSRGCPNHCAYCAVPRLEPDLWVNPTWRSHIVDEKPHAMISDNNLSACPTEHVLELIEFLVQKKKRVILDNGLDCKLITDEMAAELARVRWVILGLRLAFDRMEEDGIFQEAVNRLRSGGVAKSNMMAYTLFNFTDTPQEADYRMHECVRLGIQPYPQRYEPLNITDRDKPFIGRHWTPNLLRAFRLFWMMAGYYKRGRFVDWAQQQDKYPLTADDWAAWSASK